MLTKKQMSKGGKTTANKYGSEYMRMIGKKGGKRKKASKKASNTTYPQATEKV